MLYFLIAFALAFSLVWLVKTLMLRIKLVDVPDGVRKLHRGPVALGGGLALFLAFWSVIGYVVFFTDLLGKNLRSGDLLGVFGGSLLLIIIGIWDEKKTLSARLRFLVVLLAVGMAVAGGVGIDKITNPLGGVIYLNKIILLADILVFVWILGMTYTVKILDGLDGLAAGITAIGALVLYGVASGARWHQPDMALVALIFAGVCLGFLVWNFSPAKIFLGESGSLFLGYILGILAVISGGKVATALLVMAIPILDLTRVIIVRVQKGSSIFQGDREHLHFYLRDHGWSEKKVVVFLYFLAIIFGILTLFLQSVGKLIVLLFLFLIMGGFALTMNKYIYARQRVEKK